MTDQAYGLHDRQQQPVNAPLIAEQPKSGNSNFDRRRKKHEAAIASFSVREKSGIANGLVMNRDCTDCFFLLLFIAFIGTMIGLAAYSFLKGNVRQLIGPLDAAKNICGYDAYEGYDSLYLTDLGDTPITNINTIFESGVCVDGCPKSSDAPITIECKVNSVIQSCDVPRVYKTVNIGYYCFPTFDDLSQVQKDNFNKVKDDIKDSKGGRAIEDIFNTSKTLLICLCTSVVFSIIYMYIMSRCPWGLAMLSLMLIECSLAGIAGFAWYNAFTGPKDQRLVFYVIGGSFTLFFLIYNCVLCCHWKALKTAIAIIDAAADFFVATKRIIFVSIIYFFVTIIVFVIWMGGLIMVVSLAKITVNKSITVDVINAKEVEITGKVLACMIFMTVGLIWGILWINDKTKFICMTSAATYYFSSGKDREGSASVMTGFKFAYFKHAGSLALGSLIHVIVIIIRFIVESLAQSAERDGNGVAKLIACLARCLVGCIEDIVEFLNKTAYCFMAISGQNYCTSAWNGFMVTLKHCAKFYYAVSLAGMFVFMGILSIAGVNVGLGYLLIKFVTGEGGSLDQVTWPIVTIGVMSMIIASIFFGLFDEAVLATIHCFAVDMDMNDGECQFGPPSYHDKLRKIYGDDSQKHHVREQYKGNDGLEANTHMGTGAASYQQNQMS